MAPWSLSDEARRDLLEWCQHHYQSNLAGLVIFDPTLVNAPYPRGDLNILLVLDSAPPRERERQETVAKMVLQVVASSRSLVCRVQTVEEINLLAQMKLPVLEIYLREAEILYDRDESLRAIRSSL